MADMGNGRPHHETAAQQVDETGSQPTRLPASFHQAVEWENDLNYHLGYADGYAAAERDIADEIARATGVKAYDAKAVIRWLCNSIDLDKRHRRPEPYTSPANGTALGAEERDAIGRWAA